MDRIQPIDSKQLTCSTAVFYAALQNLKTLCGLYLSHFSMDWAEILHDCFLGGKDPAYRFKTVTLKHCSIRCSAAESLNNKSLYLSHFSTDWAEILHDDSLDGKDQVYSRTSDPAALQSSMQRCRIFKQYKPISQLFLGGLSWNFARWLSRWKGLSLKSKQWPPLSPRNPSQLAKQILVQPGLWP